MLPARAVPVPFCFLILRVEPVTKERLRLSCVPLALGGQEALHIEVNRVVVWLDAKHRIVEVHRLLRLGSFAAVNAQFHDASGLRMITVAPL